MMSKILKKQVLFTVRINSTSIDSKLSFVSNHDPIMCNLFDLPTKDTKKNREKNITVSLTTLLFFVKTEFRKKHIKWDMCVFNITEILDLTYFEHNSKLV